MCFDSYKLKCIEYVAILILFHHCRCLMRYRERYFGVDLSVYKKTQACHKFLIDYIAFIDWLLFDAIRFTKVTENRDKCSSFQC